MLEDPTKWRELVAEYAALRQLSSGQTQQARGQRFNGMIAELLSAFGLRAKSDQRSLGELDVVFTYGGRRFILEAKWERGRTGTGPIAKLQRRVEQRMAGVTGIFLAMKGFTAEAIAEVDRGRRLDVLLLDQSHWEAMLSGFVSPQELFDLATDAASFQARAYTPIAELLKHPTATPRVATEPAGRPIDDRVTTIGPIPQDDLRYVGLGVQGSRTPLLTLGQGILAVDLAGKRVNWAVPVAGCSNGSLSAADGSVFMARGNGIGRWKAGQLTTVSSGSAKPHDSHLLMRPDGSIWCLDRGSPEAAPAQLIKVGLQVGDEKRYRLPTSATAATWLTRTRLVVANGGDLLVLSSRFTVEWRLSGPAGNIRALTAVNEHTVVMLMDDLTVALVDTDDPEPQFLGRINRIGLPGVVVRRTEGSILALGHHFAKEGHLGVAEVDILGRRPAHEHPSQRGTARQAEPGGSRAQVPPVVVTPPMVPRAAVVARATVVPTTRLPAEPPPVTITRARADGGLSTEERLDDQRRGYADGLTAAAGLPLYALEGLLACNFEVVSWLRPWRDQWERIASGRAGAGEALADWLPPLALHLGVYAAPPGVAHGQIAPSAFYVIGFADGAKAAWLDAVRSRIVPADAVRLRQWIQAPPPRPGLPTGLQTIAGLSAAAKRVRRLTIWKWTGRGVLWLMTSMFCVGEFGAIGATVTGGWEPNTVSSAVIGNACFGVPLLGLLWFAIWDLRRVANGGRPQVQHHAQPPSPPAEQPAPSTDAMKPQAEPPAGPVPERADWVVSRPDRANPPAEYATFATHSGLYWTVVALNSLLIIILAIVIAATGIPALVKVLLGLTDAFLIFVTIAFGKLASNPTRLEIGKAGIQIYSRSGTSWFPWQALDRVEITRLEAGRYHLVAWCSNPELFPESDNLGWGPRFLPKLNAVGICPLNILHTRRHLVARALRMYGGNRYGRL
ncbi:restriction endonuclease [Micromonospora sp. WMMD734]|uniref:restriction endonuclease n=1 Tax=Micromonospora sp. WMMD734 TaxID=3404129 RepID=UPI003B950179